MILWNSLDPSLISLYVLPSSQTYNLKIFYSGLEQ